MKRKPTRKQFDSYFILKIILLLIIVWFLGSGLVNLIKDKGVQTMVVDNQISEEIIETYGVLDLSEVTLAAPVAGQPVQLISEGDRVRNGNGVFQIGSTTVYAPLAGMVSYHIDGLEDIHQLSELLQLDLATYHQEQQNPQEDAETTISAGQIYGKIINSFDQINICLVCPVSPYITGLQEGDSIKVRLLDIETELTGTITETIAVSTYEKGFRIDLGCPPQQVLQQRVYSVVVPYNQNQVLKIPKKALVNRKGEDGVYRLQKGFVFWQAIMIVEENEEDDTIVVTGLDAGDIIVTTPQLVKEKENIKY